MKMSQDVAECAAILERETHMFNPFDTPGLRYVGEYSHPQVNHGQPLPVFEPVAPAGRPSINSLEGWLKFCKEDTA